MTEVIIFDLDGTLIDTNPGIAAAALHAAVSFGLPEPTADFIRANIGGGARNLISKICGEDKKALVDDMTVKFLEYYNKHAEYGTSLYPGVRETLEFFWGKKKMAVATAKTREGTMSLLVYYDILKYFDRVISMSEMKKPKPDPGCVYTILNELNAKTALMVGDTVTDVKTANNARIPVAAVTYGYGPEKIKQEGGYDYLFDSISDIQNLNLD
jgi:phosphoglycolate phosphatase